jgi:hypothetical protein
MCGGCRICLQAQGLWEYEGDRDERDDRYLREMAEHEPDDGIDPEEWEAQWRGLLGSLPAG